MDVEGAEALPGPCDLVLVNELCGCERLPALFCTVVGWPGLILGAVVMAGAWPWGGGE